MTEKSELSDMYFKASLTKQSGKFLRQMKNQKPPAKKPNMKGEPSGSFRTGAPPAVRGAEEIG